MRPDNRLVLTEFWNLNTHAVFITYCIWSWNYIFILLLFFWVTVTWVSTVHDWVLKAQYMCCFHNLLHLVMRFTSDFYGWLKTFDFDMSIGGPKPGHGITFTCLFWSCLMANTLKSDMYIGLSKPRHEIATSGSFGVVICYMYSHRRFKSDCNHRQCYRHIKCHQS